MTAPTITAIRQEALRLFPRQPRVTAVSVGRLPLREGWLCTVRLPGGADLSTFALTKQGAMADAYDLLKGLQAVPTEPACDPCEGCDQPATRVAVSDEDGVVPFCEDCYPGDACELVGP